KFFLMKDDPLKGPRLKSSKYFEYKCPKKILGLHGFFYKEPASKWCLETFLNNLIDKETDLDFEQSKELFFANLTQIKNHKAIDNPIRLFCSNYIDWIE
ncbi:4024_t:CDS:1, partial [Acaulospora morrowiae]